MGNPVSSHESSRTMCLVCGKNQAFGNLNFIKNSKKNLTAENAKNAQRKGKKMGAKR
jgi:hypothetical protein